MKVMVVGGGLAGPLLAQGLVRAGVDVALYEREAAVNERSQGYRIHLEPEGDLALKACLPPDLYDEAVATSGKRGSAITMFDRNLKVIRRITAPPPSDTGHGQHLSVDRVTLRRILLTGLDTRHATYERYELLDNGQVRAYFTGGETVDADLLVGADGTHSRVRAQLLPHAEVVETGQSLIFGRTALTPEARAVTPAEALDGFTVVVGKRGMFMPLAGHEPRNGDPGYVMWVVGTPAVNRGSSVDGVALRAAAARLVAKWHPDITALINLASPTSVHATTIRTAKPVPPWTTVPVTLIGDAIHTMVPAGIGAAVALRDAALLCQHITDPTTPLLDAVHTYETAMLDYGFAAVARSLDNAG